MDVVGEGTIQLSDMVTMRGDGVSLANSGGQSNGVVGVGVSGGSGSGSGIIGESKTLATIHNNNNTNNNNQPLIECHSNGTTSSATNGDAQWKMVPQDSSKMNKIREIVENSASVASKCVVEDLLQQVGQLSDIEKFLLYLKLPVGRPPDSDPLKQPLNPLGSRCEIQLTITWIRTHLEMNSEVSLPKREVYNEYMHYCNMNSIKALSTADFGKVMKQVFPGVRPRRLGQRGASKYCYSGLRKKWSLDPPELPDLNDNVTKKNMLGVDGVADESEVERAAGCLVMEWAEKLCSVKFECMRDLALHLVHKNYVDNRSVAAFTLLSVANQKQGMLMSGGGSNGGKHRETQLQLQRKLQEREQIREQKRKLQEQQPAITKCANERPKSRRRSAASRNPSGETVTNGAAISTPNTQNNKTGVGINHSSGSSLPSAVSATTTASNGNCDSLASELPNGATTNDITGGESNNVIGLMSIKQEQTFKQEQSLDFLDSFCEDKSVLDGKNDTFNSNLITTVGHSLPPGRKNCNTNMKNNFNTECNKPSSNKVSISKPNPSKKSFLIMPSPGSKTTSPKPRFKAIQPKVSDGFQGLVSGGSQWSDVLGGNSEESAHSRTEVSLGVTGVGDLVTSQQPVSKEPYQQGLLPNNNNVNSHEADDELMQYVNKQATVDMDDAQKSSQLSELRKLLQRNLPSNNVGNTRSHLTDSDMVDQESTGAGGMRRRVSFQPSIDGGDVLNPLMGGQTVGSVPPSPNTRRTQFNFTPIGNNVDQVQGMSQCSSTNASPFMSPRNTPLPRSRHNSGQTSSTYVTPRSTPFTPDQPVYPVASESSTPFMSPIATPMYPRSRHNSSQNLRTPYTPTCRSRHSSGAPTFRHAPYAADELSNRRGGKFRSRHSSGSVPPSPSSAPLSPLVQDMPVHPPQDSLSLQLPSMLHHMLKNKQPVTGYSDLRRRHMSAGPTIHYQPQPPAFQPDPLSQEISNVLTNPQAGPSNAPQGSSNRPQSVPLLQMLNMPCNPESFPKSHPNTPVVNQQFSFSDCCTSQPSSYAPTPVPSEYSDFIENYSLDIDPMLDGGLPNDGGGGSVGLESVDPLALSGSHSSDLSTLSDPLQVPPNVNPFSNDYQTDCISSRPFDTSRSDDVLEGNSCCLDNTVNQQNTTTNTSEVLIGTSSMLTLNALNRSGHESGTGGLEEDFQPTLADLGDQEVFNSLVLDVNKD